MTLVSLFLVNAVLSFALSLALAALLGPEGFGRYAVALAIVVVINTALFEWLRLSTTRYYSDRSRAEDPGVRATLDRAYAASAILLVLGAAAGIGSGARLGLSGRLLAAAVFCGLAYGFCEYAMARARARFLEGPYAVLVLGRGLGGFVFAAGAAFLVGEPALVLAGAALAALLVTLLVRTSLSDPGPRAPVRRDLLAAFARYGLPLVVASALYQVLPLLNRTLLAGREGFAEAGYFSLASEVGTRLFQNLGSALDLVLFQLAVRAEERHGRAEAERQVGRNAAAIGAVVLPSAFGLLAVWPAFEAVFVPDAFRGRLEAPMRLLVPALAAFALVQYALNPLFQLRRRTGPVVAAAAAALAVDLGLVLFWPGLSGAAGYAAAQLAGLAAGLLVLCGLAASSGARLPLRDFLLAGAAAATMAALIWPLREVGPAPLTLALQVGAGGVAYGLLAWLWDVAGLRAAARPLLAGLRRRRPERLS